MQWPAQHEVPFRLERVALGFPNGGTGTWRRLDLEVNVERAMTGDRLVQLVRGPASGPLCALPMSVFAVLPSLSGTASNTNLGVMTTMPGSSSFLLVEASGAGRVEQRKWTRF
jgi:hypothetical protein